jgi:hypothetical protein
MELQVEKDVVAAPAKLLNQRIAGRIVQLHADFEPATGIPKTINEFKR